MKAVSPFYRCTVFLAAARVTLETEPCEMTGGPMPEGSN